jgi:hypothetical protein
MAGVPLARALVAQAISTFALGPVTPEHGRIAKAKEYLPATTSHS